jgi:hypothetical protein
MPGKYGHGLALTPVSESLLEAMLRLSAQDALRQLMGLADQGWPIQEIESRALSPALTKIGEMWLRGRLDESRLERITALAESVERQFHVAMAKAAR